MSEILRNSDFLKVVKGEREKPNCDRDIQLDVYYSEDGVAKANWQVSEKFLNAIGVSMGGYLAGAADITMAYAVASKLSDEYTFVSIDLNTKFYRPVVVGQAHVVAKVDKIGRKLAFVEAEVTQNGKKVGSVTSSIMITKL